MTPRANILQYRFQILVESERTWLESTDLLSLFLRLPRYKKGGEFHLYVLFEFKISTAHFITDPFVL